MPFTAIIVEEAAEIVEAHVLAALQPSATRLIQIGDHLQLRPKVASYKLQVLRRPLPHRQSMFSRLDHA